MLRRTLLASAVIVLGAYGARAAEEPIQLHAMLDGSHEVPASDSKGKGTFEGTYDKSTKELKYTITYEGFASPVVAAHFHGPAAAGSKIVTHRNTAQSNCRIISVPPNRRRHDPADSDGDARCRACSGGAMAPGGVKSTPPGAAAAAAGARRRTPRAGSGRRSSAAGRRCAPSLRAPASPG